MSTSLLTTHPTIDQDFNFTGIVTAPDVKAGTMYRLVANTKFVTNAINAVIAGAPSTLDTLKEIASSLGGDVSILKTLTSAINSETTRATNAESSLTSALGVENNRAIQAENSLTTA